MDLSRIVDMARTKFVERAQAKIDEIVQNLAIIMYPTVPTSLKLLWALEFKTGDKIDEIVQNLALIMQPTAPANLKPHWKIELRQHLMDLMVGHTEKARISVFSKVFKMYDITEVQRKWATCIVKFKKENLEADEAWFESVNDVMNEHLKQLFEFCAKRQYDELENYVDAL